MSKIVSLRDGATAAARAIVFQRAGTLAAPTTISDAAWSCKGGDYLHIYVQLTTSTEVEVQPYFWSDIAQQWFAGEAIVFNATNGFWAIQEIRGQALVAFAINTNVGGGTCSIWAGKTHENEGE